LYIIKRILITVLILVVLAGAGIHYWLHQEPPNSVIVAENALATKGLVAIGYFNNDLLTTILDYTRGEEDPAPLSMPGMDVGLWDDLYSGSVNLKENLDHVTFGISLPLDTTTITSDHSKNTIIEGGIIALGTFNWNSIRSTIQESYIVEDEQNNIYKITNKQEDAAKIERICPGDENTKNMKNDEFYIHATNTRLVASISLENLNMLISRLDKNSDAEADISKWREFRKGKLASTGFLYPNELIASTTGMTKYLLQQEFTDETELRKVFTGASVDYLKAGFKFDVHLQANNQEWIKESSDKILNAVNDLKKESAENLPTLHKLLSGFKVSYDKKLMDVSFSLDVDTINKIPDLISEFIGSLFSFNSGSEEESKSEERIDENPWDYSYNKAFEQLSDYYPGENRHIPSITDGPFGIDIDKVSVGEKSKLLELDIKTQIRLPSTEGSWFDSGAELTLAIESVKGKDGSELLRDEYCIEKLEDMFADKNRIPKSGFNYSNDDAYVSKTIRLVPEPSFKDIDKVVGKTSFTIPTRVKRMPVELKRGTVVEHNGMRFYLSSIKQQSVSYQVSGDKEKLLEVRALNSKGQTLRSGFSTSSSYKNVKSFKGDVKGLEIYVLEKQAEHERAFELNAEDIFKVKYNEEKKILPILVEPDVVKKSKWNRLKSKDISLGTLNYYGRPLIQRDDKVVAEYIRGPLIITNEHKYDQKWSNQPSLQIYMPFFPELIGNLSALETHITKPLNQKDQKEFKEFVEISAGQNTETGEYVARYSYKENPYIVKNIWIDLDLETGTKIETLEGKLIFRLPQKVSRTKVELSEIGKPVNINENTLTVREINKGFIPRMLIDFEGQTEKLINIVAITQTGERVFPAQTELSDNKWLIQFDLGHIYTHLELIMAEDQSIIEYPFNLKPEYTLEQ